MGSTGVLLTAFGGPDSIEACGPFMRNLTGREPSPEMLERVRNRYLAIGGASPLPEIARNIADALSERFDGEVPVVVGMRYWHPYIADAMSALKEAGVTRVVAVSLSPFESRVSSGAYREAVEEAAAALGGLEVIETGPLGETDTFADVLAAACRDAMKELAQAGCTRPLVLFSAHSLPVAELVEDDPYVAGLYRAVEEIAAGLGMGSPGVVDLGGITLTGSEDGPVTWVFAYQSKGNRPGEWLGPLVEDVAAAAAEAGFDGIASCPVGFLTDHMETKYDLDVELADAVLLSGMEFFRADVPNDSLEMVSAIADCVRPYL
ncbi:MAG: ferrochelatase [Actinobacteria bacterium]|nr:MAG: ferrochelatase [Actinomycetota bacterium]